MAKVIQVNFLDKKVINSATYSPDKSKRIPLKAVRAFLGFELFQKAFYCPMTELQLWVNHPNSILYGESEAYQTIYNYRLYRQKKARRLRLVTNLGLNYGKK